MAQVGYVISTGLQAGEFQKSTKKASRFNGFRLVK
jgi:hypothetical protein